MTPLGPLLGVLLLLLAAPGSSLKLKFDKRECMSYDVQAYTPFDGSFVSMADIHGNQVGGG